MFVTGTWEIKWDTTPPTLRMIRTASDVEGFEKHTEEGKLIMLDNESFVLASDEDLKNGNQRKFSRPKK